MESPLWLQSVPVRQLLNMLVDRLDGAEQRGSAKAQSVALDKRTWPALYEAPVESQKEDLWEHVVAMERFGWLSIKPGAALKGRSGYAASPRVVVADEVAVRTAVARLQRVKSTAECWRDAVMLGLEASDHVKRVVSQYCIDIPDRVMAEVVQQLNRLPTFADKPMLLREVSSQLFWGMSKVLDNRQGLIAAVLGTEECPFPDSPIQLHVFLPSSEFHGVLFIENLVSFERATRSSNEAFDGLVLVYASGFKGSAQRLRSEEGCSLFYAARGGLEPNLRVAFQDWLFGDCTTQAYFWGDLDFAGMRILAAMRRTFIGLAAWEPGYAPMLSVLIGGQGHSPEAADKQGQIPVLSTGCSYADAHLLSALHSKGKFVDQEMFSL